MIRQLLAPPFILIGMHRSGTSMLARVLHARGIFMGNDQEKNAESRYFVGLNEELLRKCGGTWSDPKDVNAPVEGFGAGRWITRYVKAQSDPAQLIRLFAGGAWGWKDPRNTFTLPSWLALFPKAKVIHIYRNGMDVALSLRHRSLKKPSEAVAHAPFHDKGAGLQLWETYVARAFAHEAELGRRMLTVQFEKLIARDPAEVARVEEFCGVAVGAELERSADESRTFRFEGGEHDDLIALAKRSQWMRRLGYS